MGQKENNIQNVEDGPVSSLFTITAPFDGTVVEKCSHW